MPPCPPAAALPGAGTVVGRGSVIQAAAANCYQPNGGAGTANLNDLYYMDFGAPATAAAMYHQKAVNKNKKPKKYGSVGRPSAVGSPGTVVQQTSCPATGPKRKSREGKFHTDEMPYKRIVY